MFLFFKLLNLPNIYWDAPDKGGSGGSTEEEPGQVLDGGDGNEPDASENDEPIKEPSVDSEFPVGDKTLDQLLDEDNPDGPEKPGEGKKATPKEQGTKDGEETKQNDAGEGQPAPEPTKIKVGDSEYEPDQVKKAMEVHGNWEKWRANLTQRGQLQTLIDSLPEDQQLAVIEELKPIITKKEALPTGIDKSQPIKVKTKDPEYGDEVELEFGWDHDVVKQVSKELRTEFEEEYAPVREENIQLKATMEAYDQQTGGFILDVFLDNHPEFDIRDEDQTAMHAYNAIVEAGEDHPKMDKFTKVVAVLREARAKNLVGPKGMEKAYKNLFGDGPGNGKPPADPKNQREQEIIDKQKKLKSGGPSDANPPQDEEEKRISQMSDLNAQIHSDLMK